MERITEVIWTAGAGRDLQEVYQRQESGAYPRGNEFLRATDAALALLRRFPERGSRVKHSNRLRRVLLGRQREYGLYYSVVGSRLILSALVDLRQDPKTIDRIIAERT